MANIYDRVLKEIIEPALRPLASILLNLSFEQAKEIKDKIQYTLEREGDHLKMLVFEDERSNDILHLEFHVPDEEIGPLMLLKKSMLTVLLQQRVLQYVIYLGSKKRLKNLKPIYKDEFTEHRFEVIRIKDFSYHQFLESTVPEVITWAILADYEEKKPEEVFREILLRVDAFSKNKTELGQHIRRLEVLSKLRKLQTLFIKTSKEMAFLYDLRTDIRFKQGKAEGKAEGIAEAKKAEMEKNRTAVTKMLKTGRFTLEEISDFLILPIDFVKEIQAELENKKKKK